MLSGLGFELVRNTRQQQTHHLEIYELFTLKLTARFFCYASLLRYYECIWISLYFGTKPCAVLSSCTPASMVKVISR
jgi:hypothetical protein